MVEAAQSSLHRLVIASVVVQEVVPAPVKGPGCSHETAAWKAGRRGSFAGCCWNGLQVDLRWGSSGGNSGLNL